MDYKDYYSILDISRDADEQTIRSAFRRMARVYHPDVNANKAESTEKFKEINEAYTVLSDPDKRARYDLFSGRYEQYQRSSSTRDTGPRPSYGTGYSSTGPQTGYGAASSTSRTSAGPSQQRQSQSQRRTHTRTMDEEDFERIFRGFAWAYSAAAGRRSRPGNSASDFSDFFDALFGNLRGTAGADMAQEPSEVRPGRDIEVTAEISLEEALRGATRTLTYSDGRKVEVTIPPGVDAGSKLRIRGQGERVFGRPRGDLFMTIRVQPHHIFTRDGADLRVQVTVDYETAMRSGEVTVPTMDGVVKLKIPAGTRSGQSFRLRGLGMPTVLDPTTRGDLIAAVTVKAPAAAPHSRTEKSTQTAKAPHPTARRRTLWRQLRQAFGVALVTMGLVALAAQALLSAGTGWQLLAALSVVLLVHGITGKSGWALAGSALALAGAVWTVSQLELITTAMLLEQAWPLLPLAAGIMLLLRPAPKRRA
jgi:curved DNA-binding protein